MLHILILKAKFLFWIENKINNIYIVNIVNIINNINVVNIVFNNSKGDYMKCLIHWNKEKHIHELVTDESKFTPEEIEKMYQPKGELKKILEIVVEDPNVEEVEINDKILVIRK